MTKRTSSGKRRGANASDREPERHIPKHKSNQNCTDDKEFYLRDGDVIILAEQTRFKLSRFVLRRGSALMEELLESSDPVELTITESAEDIRALSWATHSFPTDIADQSNAPVNLRISVLYICHKLQFIPHAQWAKRAIFDSILSGALGSPTTSDEAIETLNSVLSSASERDIAKLLMALTPCSISECPICTAGIEECVGAVWGLWLLRLQSDPSLSPRQAIDCAEALGLRSFLGRLYYTQLVITNSRATSRSDPPGTTALRDSELDLTEEQTTALFQGYWSLSVSWESIREPPQINTPNQASHDWECYAAWEQMWHEGIYGDGESPYHWNPIGALLRLSQMEIPLEDDEVSTDEDGEEVVARCGCFFREEARSTRQQLLGTLADHFVRSGTSSETQLPPELCPTKVIITPTSLASVRDQRRTGRQIVPASPPSKGQKAKQLKKKSGEQRRLEAKAAKNRPQPSANADADATTAILQRAWALQVSSGAVASSNQTEQYQTMDAPEASSIRDPSSPGREFVERRPSESHQDEPNGSFSAPEPSAHAPPQVIDFIVIEDTPPPSPQHPQPPFLPPPPPPPPLDRAVSLGFGEDSDQEQPSQNSYLFFKQGAQPAKIPKAMFDSHGRPVPN